MKKILLLIVLSLFGAIGYSTTWTIANSGTTFTPETITITLGDNVDFTLGSVHNAVEVSQATWNANENTPLSGGFSLPKGGGSVPIDKLTVGIHYFVCEPHASSGMKGMITVLDPTGLAEKPLKEAISIFPNPSNGNFQLQINSSLTAKMFDLGIYTVKGEKVFAKSDLQQQNTTNIEISDLPKGIYVMRLYGKKEIYSRKIVVQ